MKTKTDILGRRNRFYPQSTGKRINLQERDWLWLQKLRQHGPLASSFLLQFSKHLGRSDKRAKERLTDLFNENNTKHGGPYLTRPPQQFQTVDSRYNQLVYDLAPAGIQALKANGFWNDRSGVHGGPWWHKLMVSSTTGSIELGTIDRDDLTFIPQSAILERAETSLCCPVSYIDPIWARSVIKNLQPDAIFGLEHHKRQGSQFRFFVVEADRSTEPVRSQSPLRKSIERNVAQYVSFIAARQYQKHLNLTAPLLILNVTCCEKRMVRMMSSFEANGSEICAAALFKSWTDFSAIKRIPEINTELMSQPWLRPNLAAIKII